MFPEFYKHEKELSDKLMYDKNILSKMFKNKTTITGVLFNKYLIYNIIKTTYNKSPGIFYNLTDPVWKKEYAMFLYYNKEYVISQVLFNTVNKNLFLCYFLDAEITIENLKKILIKKSDSYVKYILKDFIKLKNVDFTNIDVKRFDEIEKLFKVNHGAYHMEKLIKKCLKYDYVTAYYFLAFYEFYDYYQYIHKILKIILLKNKIQDLEKENEILRNHIEYMPEATGYLKAKENFEKLKLNTA
jgi:hypothetical protein